MRPSGAKGSGGAAADDQSSEGDPSAGDPRRTLERLVSEGAAANATAIAELCATADAAALGLPPNAGTQHSGGDAADLSADAAL